MKYIKVEWPDIQDYMNRPDWKEGHYYDSSNDAWFIPETWEEELDEQFEDPDGIGDLEDAMG